MKYKAESTVLIDMRENSFNEVVLFKCPKCNSLVVDRISYQHMKTMIILHELKCNDCSCKWIAMIRPDETYEEFFTSEYVDKRKRILI